MLLLPGRPILSVVTRNPPMHQYHHVLPKNHHNTLYYASPLKKQHNRRCSGRDSNQARLILDQVRILANLGVLKSQQAHGRHQQVVEWPWLPCNLIWCTSAPIMLLYFVLVVTWRARPALSHSLPVLVLHESRSVALWPAAGPPLVQLWS